MRTEKIYTKSDKKILIEGVKKTPKYYQQKHLDNVMEKI